MQAWLFPGQGSQFISMARFLRGSPRAADVFAMAESMSGLQLRSVMEKGPAEMLRRPNYLEPSITALQVACVDELRLHGVVPDAVTGYSMGEIGALYAAGCLSREQALTLAVRRGKVQALHTSAGRWRSAAVSFRQPPDSIPIEWAPGVFTATINTRRDITVTGEEHNVTAAEGKLRQLGSLSTVEIDGPWHSPLAKEAGGECAAASLSFAFAAPRTAICLSSAGGFESDPAALQASLCRSVGHPIYWTRCLDQLWEAGVRSTLEVAPGHMLTGFLRTEWRGRDYSAQFITREGGRTFDFEAYAKMAADSMKQSAAAAVPGRIYGTC